MQCARRIGTVGSGWCWLQMVALLLGNATADCLTPLRMGGGGKAEKVKVWRGKRRESEGLECTWRLEV